MPSDATTVATTFPLPRVIPCLQCREQRKKCRRSLQNDQCDRCIKRKVPCSFQYILSDRHKIFDVDSKESLQAFVQTLNTIESLEDQISNIEMQLKQKPRNQLEWHSSIANDKENSSKSNWELAIHSSNSQTLTLNVQVERTVDLLQFINQIYLELGINIPRQFPHPHQESSMFIPVQQRRFPKMLLNCAQETLKHESWHQAISLDLQMSALNSYHQQITPWLVQSYFDCKNAITPLIHPQYLHQNRHRTIGNHLVVLIGCSMSLRYCVNSPFFNLPHTTQLHQLSYYINCCTKQIDELMLLDNPPLSLALSLWTLAVTHFQLMNPRKSWLLMAAARAYLQQHLNDYIDSIMDKDGPSNAELETYKFALILCEKSDEPISYVVQSLPAGRLVSFDYALLAPKLIPGDDPLWHSIIKQSFLWDLMQRHVHNCIGSSSIITDSIRTVNWNVFRQINSEFTTWYTNLPRELKIGDKPFDIAKMDIPEDSNTSVACLQLSYYGEWVTFYGDIFNPDITSDSSMDEAARVESTHVVFLASLSVVKISEFLHQVEMCRIEYHKLLFTCEPLLCLATSTNSPIASEARQALQKALIILKSLLKHNLFCPIAKNMQENGNPIAFCQRLVQRISNLFTSYGLEF